MQLHYNDYRTLAGSHLITEHCTGNYGQSINPQSRQGDYLPNNVQFRLQHTQGSDMLFGKDATSVASSPPHSPSLSILDSKDAALEIKTRAAATKPANVQNNGHRAGQH